MCECVAFTVNMLNDSNLHFHWNVKRNKNLRGEEEKKRYIRCYELSEISTRGSGGGKERLRHGDEVQPLTIQQHLIT